MFLIMPLPLPSPIQCQKEKGKYSKVPPINPSMGINPESSFRGTPAVHDFEEFGWVRALSWVEL